MKKFDKNRAIALIATLLFHAIVVAVLVFSFLYYSWPPKDMPIPKQSEILFGGEYVMLGNIQQPASQEMDNAIPEETKAETESEGEDMKNTGEAGESAELISTNEESPMKVKKEEKKKKPGPSKKEIKEQERIKREKEKSDKINKRVAFKSSGKGDSKEGSPNGNADVGARSGAPGFSLKGRTLENWGRPSSNVDGKVVIEVRVDSRGRVISARYRSGTGSAAASTSVRRSCEKASKNSRFSVSTETTTDQVGTITWRFE
ncbi:MAG: hypothetical protein RR706_01730 [Muribaculaceae bacterium]